MFAPHLWLNRLLAFVGIPTARLALAETFADQDLHGPAFPLFAQAARAGLRQAQYRLGHCYLMGLGVPPSIGEALRWLRRAAEGGNCPAQTELGALALQGVFNEGKAGLFEHACLSANFHLAEHWCRQAAAKGSAEAKALLGFILSAGPDEIRDEAAADQFYRESAQAGWSRGQLGLAMALLRDDTPDSNKQAAALLASAADNGMPVAHYLLGVLAETGIAGPVDFTAAAARYKGAAELGHVGGQVRYGFALLHGRGVEPDAFSAETWLRRAALAGDIQAAAVIGYLYARDGELPPNLAEAAIWFERAATGGHVTAARILGQMLQGGTGIPQDPQQAVHWLRVAANQGDDIARTSLTHLALTRQTATEDTEAVLGWLEEAATGNDPDAQFKLGLFRAQGIGVEQDLPAALNWICQAAQGGHPDATRMLAQLVGPA
jgi:uncharacterized protein